MICKNCGTENEEGSIYCKNCQTNLTEEDAVESAQEAAVEQIDAAESAQEDAAEPAQDTQAEPDNEYEDENPEADAEQNEADEAEADGAEESESLSDTDEIGTESEPTHAKTARIVTICVIAAAAIALIIGGIFYFRNRAEKMKEDLYSKDYLPVYGENIGKIADESGYKLKEFLNVCHLPEDMPASVDLYAAQMSMKLKYALNLGDTEDDIKLNAQDLKDRLGIEADIDPEAQLGPFLDTLTLRQYISIAYSQYLAYGMDVESIFSQLNAMYEFGENVTLDTKWKDVRGQYEKKSIEMRKAAENPTDEPTEEEPAEEATPAAEAPAGEATPAPAADAAAAPADGE